MVRRMDATRHLLVIADDYGIGPSTSRGIRDLASRGLVTGTVLLVNSPFAHRAVEEWRRADLHADIGWHPCLTQDQPVAPVDAVASLVGPDGNFWPLGSFVRRLLLHQLRPEEIRRELYAQFNHFRELTGHQPCFVNSHQHIALFPPVGAILL
ncbi:MAG: ChbG/HpnK family deacetylase, partial [Candidatus Acidiferrum sp.]